MGEIDYDALFSGKKQVAKKPEKYSSRKKNIKVDNPLCEGWRERLAACRAYAIEKTCIPEHMRETKLRAWEVKFKQLEAGASEPYGLYHKLNQEANSWYLNEDECVQKDYDMWHQITEHGEVYPDPEHTLKAHWVEMLKAVPEGWLLPWQEEKILEAFDFYYDYGVWTRDRLDILLPILFDGQPRGPGISAVKYLFYLVGDGSVFAPQDLEKKEREPVEDYFYQGGWKHRPPMEAWKKIISQIQARWERAKKERG